MVLFPDVAGFRLSVGASGHFDCVSRPKKRPFNAQRVISTLNIQLRTSTPRGAVVAIVAAISSPIHQSGLLIFDGRHLQLKRYYGSDYIHHKVLLSNR